MSDDRYESIAYFMKSLFVSLVVIVQIDWIGMVHRRNLCFA